MSTLVNTKLDFGGARRLTNVGPAQANGEPVVFEQLQEAIEGMKWKANARVVSTTNVNLSSPGTTIDGVSLSNGDRVLLLAQTDDEDNGIYIWNGSAVPMTRALDANTFEELEGAVITVVEGTSNSGTTWRQTQVGGTIDVDPVLWTSFVAGAPAATETTAGIAEIATQAEVDAGTDNQRFLTPQKLANWAGRPKRYSTSFGDGSATSYAITHNLGTEDVQVYVRETGGSKRMVLVEVQHTSTNSVTIITDTAPASNSLRVTVIA